MHSPAHWAQARVLHGQRLDAQTRNPTQNLSLYHNAASDPAVKSTVQLNALYGIGDPRDPDVVKALIIFILSSAVLVVIFFFGKNIWQRILQAVRKKEDPVLGFGFDGLTKSQLEAERIKEETPGCMGAWYMKLPMKPPKLWLRHVGSLSPILLSRVDGENGKDPDLVGLVSEAGSDGVTKSWITKLPLSAAPPALFKRQLTSSYASWSSGSTSSTAESTDGVTQAAQLKVSGK